MTRWVRVLAVLVAAVSLSATVACSDDDSAATAQAAPTAAAESTTAASTPSPPPSSPEGHLPKAVAYEGCAGAGDFWPTMTLALQGRTLWIACKEEARLVHVNALDGAPLGDVELDSFPIAVVSGLGAVWALGDTGTIYRIDPATGQIRKEIETGAAAPYNLWIGAGSVWSIDDGSGQVIRISPKSNRVVRRIAVGNGPADMVFRGTSAWVINHRDKKLVRLNTKTNKAKSLGKLKRSDAPERIAWLDGSLWITGRGTDLLRVEPDTGRLLKVVEIGAGGIDVVAAKGALWVPSRSAEVDASGLPTVEVVRRVVPGRKAGAYSRADGPVDAHGLVANGSALFLSDNTAGLVYRFALPG